MQCHSYAFSSHAIKRMFERSLSRDDVVCAIEQGDVIRDYPDDQPYPSCLILWFLNTTPIHVCLQKPFGRLVLRRKKRELRHL